MNECRVCRVRDGNMYFVYGKQCWVLWSYMDQELSRDQADISQPAAQTQLSVASLVSHLVSVKPDTQ